MWGAETEGSITVLAVYRPSSRFKERPVPNRVKWRAIGKGTWRPLLAPAHTCAYATTCIQHTHTQAYTVIHTHTAVFKDCFKQNLQKNFVFKAGDNSDRIAQLTC